MAVDGLQHAIERTVIFILLVIKIPRDFSETFSAVDVRFEERDILSKHAFEPGFYLLEILFLRCSSSFKEPVALENFISYLEKR